MQITLAVAHVRCGCGEMLAFPIDALSVPIDCPGCGETAQLEARHISAALEGYAAAHDEAAAIERAGEVGTVRVMAHCDAKAGGRMQ